MSFVGDIISDISDFFSPVTSAVKSVASTVGDYLQESSIATLLATVSTLTGNIDGLVNQFAGVVSGIIAPITGVVDSVNTLTSDIQDKIIGPIITPIATTIKEIDTLTGTIGKLVDQGIPGILAIPGAVADAVKATATSWDNSTRMLADSQAKLVTEQLVPGITSAVAPGLKEVSDNVIKFSQPKALDIDRTQTIGLDNPIDLTYIQKALATYVERFKNPESWMDQIGAVAYDLLSFAPYIIGNLDAIIEEAKAAGRATNPTTTFQQGDILAMYQRRIIDAASASQELKWLGYDDTRSKALLEQTQWQPQIEQALGWWRRELISEVELNQILQEYGVEDDSIVALKASVAPLQPPQILLDWVARGIITDQQFNDMLYAQGYDAAGIAQLLAGGIGPPQVGSLIAAKANLTAAINNWYPNTYGAQVPDDVANVARASRIDVTEVAAQWTAHWSVMPVATAVNLFFRGELSRNEVQIVVIQNQFPPEMADLFIAAQSELIQPRSVPALLARGSISEADARAALAKKGYADTDISLLINDALTTAAAKKAAASSPATHLTVGEITTAFKEAIIPEDQYSALLKEHGYSDADIAFNVALANYQTNAKAKKDHVATLKAEVSLGTKTISDAINELAQSGFSATEIERIQVTLHQQRKAASKIPSIADLTKMYKNTILTGPDFLAAIQASGYAPPWDQRMYDLLTLSGATTNATSPPGSPAA